MKNVSLVRKIALFRIEKLLLLAEEKTLENTEDSRKLAKRYVNLARKISSHYKVSIPKKLKSRLCNNCSNFLAPGINCKVRIASAHGYAAYTCECGKEKHIMYKNRGRKGLRG